MAKSPEENNPEWAEAFNAGDGEALLALYDPEAKFVMPTGDVLEGVEAIGQALGGFFALKPRIDLRTERVVRCGDTAISNGSWTVTGTGPDGTAVEMSGRDTVVLREQADSTWRMIFDNPGWSEQTIELFKAMG
jgi:uncharacterized protein (TIGR02246 family)